MHLCWLPLIKRCLWCSLTGSSRLYCGTQNCTIPTTLDDSLIALNKSISTVEFPFTVSNPLQCPAWCSQGNMTFTDNLQWDLKSNRHFGNIELNNAASVDESQQQLIKRRCPLISSSSLSAVVILWRWETRQSRILSRAYDRTCWTKDHNGGPLLVI